MFPLGAHPRIRGEYIWNPDDTKCVLGSPPHTRGISSRNLEGPPQSRLTPAYAGNIGITGAAGALFEAHPRIRGEYQSTFPNNYTRAGSPPHTRGIYFERDIVVQSPGLTPAYAGNIFPDCSVIHSLWAHPRIRGEYLICGPKVTTRLGSPPHTRGIYRKDTTVPLILRLTPAYAGNILEWRTSLF